MLFKTTCSFYGVVVRSHHPLRRLSKRIHTFQTQLIFHVQVDHHAVYVALAYLSEWLHGSVERCRVEYFLRHGWTVCLIGAPEWHHVICIRRESYGMRAQTKSAPQAYPALHSVRYQYLQVYRTTCNIPVSNVSPRKFWTIHHNFRGLERYITERLASFRDLFCSTLASSVPSGWSRLWCVFLLCIDAFRHSAQEKAWFIQELLVQNRSGAAPSSGTDCLSIILVPVLVCARERLCCRTPSVDFAFVVCVHLATAVPFSEKCCDR